MPLLADRVQETTSTQGTGAVTLLGAVEGYRTFNSVFANGDVVFYTIDDTFGNWEVGYGAVSTGVLSRTTVLDSSNSNNLVNFPAGTKRVFCVAPKPALLPNQTGSSGKFLTTDGSNPSWTTVASGGVNSVAIATNYGFKGTSTGSSSVTLSLQTNVTGILKGDASTGTVTAAAAGTDYAAPTAGTVSQLLANDGAGGFSNVTVSTGLSYNSTTKALTNASTATVSSVTFTGDGTVLSSTPSSAVTTSGTLTAALKTQTANTVLAGPVGGSTAVAPTFRSLVAADIPSLPYAGTTTGQSILAGNNIGGFQNVTLGSGLSYDTGTHILNTTGGGSSSFAPTNLGNAFVPAANSRLASDMMGDYLSIIDFGCDPTGANDSTTSLNNAIAAASVKGKALYAPAGTYKLNSTITISSGVTIFGDNPIPTGDYNVAPTKGTWFYFNHSSIGFSIANNCTTVKFRTLGTYRPTQTVPTSVPPAGAPTPVWTPTVMGADFDLAAGSRFYVYFEDIMTLNPYVAINMQQQCASVYIDKLKGTPLYRGIVTDFCADVCYVNDVHFWPFWNVFNFNAQAGLDYVQIYQLFNLRCLDVARVDGLLITNFFTFFCNSGLYVRQNANGSADTSIVNAYIDVCWYGIHIDVGTGTLGSANALIKCQNLSVNCIASYSNTYALFLAGTSDRVAITIDDFYVLNAGNSVVYSGPSTTNNTITIDKADIIKYSTTDSSRPAFYLDGNNNIATIEGTPIFRQPTPPAAYYAVANLSCYYEGIGWTITTPSRAFNTTYINTKSRPIFVTVVASLNNTANPSNMSLQTKHPLWAGWDLSSYVYVTGVNGLNAGTVSCFVPPGWSYQVNTAAAMNIANWNEM